jgi:hypothetical protein
VRIAVPVQITALEVFHFAVHLDPQQPHTNTGSM